MGINNVSKFVRFALPLFILGIALTHQNCAKVNFQGQGGQILTTGNNTQQDVSPTPAPSVPDATPTPTPTPPDASPTPTPSATPHASCTPPTGTGEILCYLSAGPGESQRIGAGNENNVQVLDIATAIPHDACMSSNACLNLINAYLNHTGGLIDGHYGPIQSTESQYTSVKTNGVCAHNPNVQHLTDAQISADLFNLQLMHQ